MTRRVKLHCLGTVVGLEEEETDEDEVRLLVWPDGDKSDNVQMKVVVPAGSFQLRQELLITIETAMQLDRPENLIVHAGDRQPWNSEVEPDE
ncbi:MAG: hypothetical protein ACYS7Y_35630 [Planctomycetota bacterium]|jgi:hypothetical protein